MFNPRSFFVPSNRRAYGTARRCAGQSVWFVLLLVPILLLAACGESADPAVDVPPSGRILLWHDWRSSEAAFLNEQLGRFEELYPDITVIRVPVSQDEFVQRFVERTTSGLGPDVILADAEILVELTRRGLLRDLNQLVTASNAAATTPEATASEEVEGAEETVETVVVETPITAVDDYLPQVLAAVNLTTTATTAATVAEATVAEATVAEATVATGDTAPSTPRYAMPYSLYTQLLYYRRDRMAQPPRTVNELINDVNQGHPATLPISLADGFWGLRAFGGSWLNEQGALALNGGALANWIDYINELQGVPGFYLDTDMTRLRNRFINGDVDLHIDSSREYGPLSAALGEALGVVALPDGPNQRPAGPLLHVDGLAISRATSPDEVRAAVLLIDYLTNAQQQARFAAAGVGRLPARRSLLYSRNLPPVSYELARQVRSAVVISANDLALWELLVAPGNTGMETFAEAVAGTRSAGQAVQIITNYLSNAGGRTVAVTDIEECPAWLDEYDGYELTLWHALADRRADTLATVAQNFAALCPGVTIKLEYRDYGEIEQDFRAAVAADRGPAMLLESTRLTAQLAADGLLMDLNRLVDPSSLQRFIPEAQAAMRYRDGLYGIPESVAVLALYSNTDLTNVPLVTLEDTAYYISPETPLALPVSFFYGYWGMSAFGEFRFETGRGVVSKADGLTRWLAWLDDVQNQPGVFIGDYAEAEARFLAGDAAYFVSGPWALEAVRSELGTSTVRVTTLPAGPYGLGLPILQVQGVMVNQSVNLREAELAVDFANYLSSPSTQLLFTQTGSHVSALVNIDLSDFPLLSGFREQAKLAVNVLETPEFAQVEALGNELYAEVLSGAVEPSTGVAAFMDAVRAVNVGDEPEGATAGDAAEGDDTAGDAAEGDAVEGDEAAGDATGDSAGDGADERDGAAEDVPNEIAPDEAADEAAPDAETSQPATE